MATIRANKSLVLSEGRTHVSSSPPSFLIMFRKENTVPKMSFASSSALRAWRVWCWGTCPFVVVSETGLDALPLDGVDGNHLRLYIQSATGRQRVRVQFVAVVTNHDDRKCRVNIQPF